jgi:hypothetical protein
VEGDAAAGSISLALIDAVGIAARHARAKERSGARRAANTCDLRADVL